MYNMHIRKLNSLGVVQGCTTCDLKTGDLKLPVLQVGFLPTLAMVI